MTHDDFVRVEMILALENAALDAQKAGWLEEVWQPLVVTASFLRDRFFDDRPKIDWEGLEL